MAEIKSSLQYARNVAQSMHAAAQDVSIPMICRTAGNTDVSVQSDCAATYEALARTVTDAQSLFIRFSAYIERSAEEFDALDQNMANAWSV